MIPLPCACALPSPSYSSGTLRIFSEISFRTPAVIVVTDGPAAADYSGGYQVLGGPFDSQWWWGSSEATDAMLDESNSGRKGKKGENGRGDMGGAEVTPGVADVVAVGVGVGAEAGPDAGTCVDAHDGVVVGGGDDGCGVYEEDDSVRRADCGPAEEVAEKEEEKERGGGKGGTELVQPRSEAVAAETDQGSLDGLSMAAHLGGDHKGEEQWTRGLRRMVDGGSPLVRTRERGIWHSPALGRGEYGG